MDLWILIVLVMISELGLHYFPYKMLLKGKELPRIAAYTLGLLGMMGPLTAWLWYRSEFEIIQTLWAVVMSAGVTVAGLYGLDHYMDLVMKDIEATEREHDVTK